nr:MAG TPA: Cwf15/Cwc15 cell cycle control protein [Caudoviricetes sp.]
MVIIQAAHLVNSSKCVAHRPTWQLMYAAAWWG